MCLLIIVCVCMLVSDVCLSVHIHTYTYIYIHILCCVLGCMLTEHVPMSTYCIAQRQLDICTRRGPECDINDVYVCVG